MNSVIQGVSLPLLAAIAIVLVVAASAAFFFLGRRAGGRRELDRLTAANASAEQMAKRIVGDAERDADALRKNAVLSGKEELIALREAWEREARTRRETLESDERRVQERLSVPE